MLFARTEGIIPALMNYSVSDEQIEKNIAELEQIRFIK